VESLLRTNILQNPNTEVFIDPNLYVNPNKKKPDLDQASTFDTNKFPKLQINTEPELSTKRKHMLLLLSCMEYKFCFKIYLHLELPKSESEKITFILSVMDPKLFITDPDTTFQLISDPDQTFKKFRIRFRTRRFSSINMILRALKWHFKTYWYHNFVRILKFSILKWSKL
jgi:hypothetical protein